MFCYAGGLVWFVGRGHLGARFSTTYQKSFRHNEKACSTSNHGGQRRQISMIDPPNSCHEMISRGYSQPFEFPQFDENELPVELTGCM